MSDSMIRGRGWTIPDHLDFGEYKVYELRGYIARQLSVRTGWATPLDMGTLNSLYAFKTGDFRIKPQFINTQLSPGKGTLWIDVACLYNLDDYPIWAADLARPYRKAELVEIAKQVTDESDQRPRPGDRDA